MPKTLTVGTDQFEFPLEGENSGYGESITDWAEAVTDALSTVQQPNDVLRTTSTISNNQTSFTNIPSFSFDTSEVRAINSEFLVTRSTTSPAVTVVESGFIEGNFDGSNWSISVRSVGDAGVEFNITSGGQVQYKSSDLAGSGYVGEIIFRAKVFNGN